MITCTGHLSVAAGIHSKVIPTGKCKHPNKRDVNRKLLNKHIRVSETDWTHCIFCHNSEDCYFGGKCRYKVVRSDN